MNLQDWSGSLKGGHLSMLIQSLKSAPNSNGTEGQRIKMHFSGQGKAEQRLLLDQKHSSLAETKKMDCSEKKIGKVELRLLKGISVKMLNVCG